MANVFASLPVPAGNGVGAWVDVSAQGPERTVAVDGGPFDGTLYIEGSNDGEASAIPAGVGPFIGPTFKPQVFLAAFNFLRVRRTASAGVGAPTVNVGAPAAVANVFSAMAVPSTDGVGTSTDISGGGDINTFAVSGPFTGQILIETSTDGVNFSPTLLFTDGGGAGQIVTGVLSAARVRRRGSQGDAGPLVSVGSQATAGASGGGFPGYAAAPPAVAAASAAGASPLVSRGDHTHAGVASAIAGTGISVSAATGAVTITNTGVTSNVAGAGISVSGATGAVTIANTGVLSIVAGSGISVSGATGNVTVTATGGAFPGFGGAPPQVNSASAAGAAGTASQSDHTHAQDLSVVYAPSQAAGQAAGILTQTYAAPNATPAVFNAVADRVLYGAHAATGLPSQSANFLYNDSTGRLGLQNAGGSMTSATIPRTLSVIEDGASAVGAFQSYITGSGGSFLQLAKGRGTFAAPTAVVANDFIGQLQFLGYGTSLAPTLSLAGVVDGTAAVSSIQMPLNFSINTTAGPTNITGQTPKFGVSWLGDVALGVVALATNATSGFTYLASSPGVPSGVPVVPAWWNIQNASNSSAAGPPTVFDTNDNRYYFNYGAAWHYLGVWDYTSTATRVPFGAATAGALTDSANLTFTTGSNTLNVSNVAAVGAGSLALSSAAVSLVLNNGPTTATLTGGLVPAADNTYALGAAAAAWTTVSANTIQGGTSTTTLVLQNDSTANSTLTLTSTFATLTAATGLGLNSGGAGDVVVSSPNNIRLNATGQTQVVGGVLIFTGGTGLNMNGHDAQLTGNAMLGPVTAVFNSNGPFAYLTTTTTNPTGTPSNPFTGGAALIYDLGNHRLDVYDTVQAGWFGLPIAFPQTAGAGAVAITNAPTGVVSLTPKWETYKDSAGVASYRFFLQ